MVPQAAIPTTADAQTQTLRVPPETLNVITRDRPAMQAIRRDTTNLELIQNFDISALQLQPRQKTVLNLDRNIAPVNVNTLNRIDPQILAGIDRQSIFSFPEVHVERREADGGADAGSATSIIYQPVITSLKPMIYDHGAGAFRSTLNFLLLSQDQSSGSISNPMPIELHSDMVNAINPNRLQIGHLNLPSTSVDVLARDARDSVQIRIVTEGNTSGYETYLRVEPALNLFTERRRLQGLGIQEIPVQLSWKGSSSGGAQTVTVSSSKGTVTPTTVNLAYNRPAVVTLRSEGLGRASVTASAPGAESNTVQIQYTFPWLFLIFSLVGGFLGGTAKFFTLKEKPSSFLATTIGSLSIGLLGAVAYFVLGINLLDIEFSSTFNEFAVLGISALIAFFGIRKLGKPGS
jgi:hypothetical protein